MIVNVFQYAAADIIYNLHSTICCGDTVLAIVGIAAFSFLFLVAIGIVLWFAYAKLIAGFKIKSTPILKALNFDSP